MAVIQGHPGPFSLPSATPPRGSTASAEGDPASPLIEFLSEFARAGLNEHTLQPLLKQACDPRRTRLDRAAMLQLIFSELPPRNDDSGLLHTKCLLAILAQDDPAVRRDLFLHYEHWHPFFRRDDETFRLFRLVSLLQKPEHRSTENTWHALGRVCSPGPKTTWSVWRGLCGLLAAQMAEVIQAFQQSRQSVSNHRLFNEHVLRVVLRLAASEDCDAETAGKRQFELLSDLAQAISAKHRLTCLCLLENTCAQWIEVEMKEHPEHPMHAKKLAHELALLAALRSLIAQLKDPSPQARL